jgi:phytol kinase
VNPAVLSTAKIIGSVILLALVLWGVSKLAKIAKLDPEVGRKLVHISLGLYCLVFPFVFSQAWEVWATCVLAVGVFMLARGTMRESLGGGLHAVKRTSYGELLFAASVALLFWLKEGHYIAGQQGKPIVGPVLYVLPILILTPCDAASALVGSRYGKRVFRIEEGSKSIEGVVVFAVTAWLLSLITILLLTNIGRGEAVLLAFIVAVFGALLEAASWRGLDNLFIPMGLYFLLANLLGYGVIGLAMIAGAFFVVLVALLKLTAGSGANRHVLAAGATLFFCIWIFSGPLSLITPGAAVAAYLLCVKFLRLERPQHDALNLLLVVLSVALAFFVASHLLKMDTIFGFNAAFAALTAGIAARFSGRWVIVSGVALLAWIAMSVRTLWWEGIREETLMFGLIGAGGILLTVILGSSLRERKVDRPWITLGGLSAGIGLISLIGTPP